MENNKLCFIDSNKVIDAKEARRISFEALTPTIKEIQTNIMQDIVKEARKGDYEVTCTYSNDYPVLDEIIHKWLTELGYKNKYENNYDDKEDYVDTTVYISWYEEYEKEEESSDDTSSDQPTS